MAVNESGGQLMQHCGKAAAIQAAERRSSEDDLYELCIY